MEDTKKEELGEPKEGTKEDIKEDEEELTYIAGDDWTIPIEFDRDISNADILFTLKKGDFTYEDESVAGDHKSDMVAVFSIPKKVTSKLEEWEYKWMVSVIENGKKVSTKPECIYVETM